MQYMRRPIINLAKENKLVLAWACFAFSGLLVELFPLSSEIQSFKTSDKR